MWPNLWPPRRAPTRSYDMNNAFVVKFCPSLANIYTLYRPCMKRLPKRFKHSAVLLAVLELYIWYGQKFVRYTLVTRGQCNWFTINQFTGSQTPTNWIDPFV